MGASWYLLNDLKIESKAQTRICAMAGRGCSAKRRHVAPSIARLAKERLSQDRISENCRKLKVNCGENQDHQNGAAAALSGAYPCCSCTPQRRRCASATADDPHKCPRPSAGAAVLGPTLTRNVPPVSSLSSNTCRPHQPVTQPNHPASRPTLIGDLPGAIGASNKRLWLPTLSGNGSQRLD